MDHKIYIGIDPGKSGGITFVYDELSYTKACPETIQDMAEEIEVCKELAPEIDKYAVIEAVHSFPGQGVRSVWTFGENYGIWLGILAANKIPYIQVTPRKWMAFYGSLPREKKDRKNKLKHLAQQRFPNLHITLKTADSVLLANYLREIKIKEKSVSKI